MKNAPRQSEVEEISADTALNIFDPKKVRGLQGIRVVDVGQGDCIGLLDQKGRVFCYVDYGGCIDHPDKGSAGSGAQDRMPVDHGSSLASVILTHWDKDHYWSANKKHPQAKQCEWLVPRQKASPQAVRFAATVDDIKCWPESRGSRPKQFSIGREFALEIRKCGLYSKKKRVEDRNVTGLAVTLLRIDSKRVTSMMLLPGDCPFHLIPHLPAAPIAALVAFHHGAGSHWARLTSKAISNLDDDCKLIYSYGLNHYGHPCRSRYSQALNRMSKSTSDARTAKQLWFDVLWE